jgi:hypothetical protein
MSNPAPGKRPPPPYRLRVRGRVIGFSIGSVLLLGALAAVVSRGGEDDDTAGAETASVDEEPTERATTTTTETPTTTAPPTTTTSQTTTTTAPPTRTTTAPAAPCTARSTSCEFANAENTGPTGPLAPVDVGCGDYVVDTPGAVVKNLDIHGTLFIPVDGVTVRNVRVHTTCNFVAVAVGNNTTLEDIEIDGDGTTDYGVTTGDGLVLRRADIHDAEDGLQTEASNLLIEDNWIHDLRAEGAPHFDGLQFEGGQAGIRIVHNTISIPDQTGTVNINNRVGPISDVLVQNNLLVGGTYTIYVDDSLGSGPITDVTVNGNRFGSHTYGYWLVRTPNRSIIFAGNVDDESEGPIS